MCFKISSPFTHFFKSPRPPEPQDQQPEPPLKPTAIATESGTESLSPATVTGATKADAESLLFYLELVQGNIKEETNLVRRQNAEVCLEFLKQHGYPAQGYRFLIHQGIMEVLNQDDYKHRKGELARQIPGCLRDTYGLYPPLQLVNSFD
ncbi:hypothetical protein F5883DRAFT_522610 [Diaporthe sp. PMI_573]|nr:hypothetical protein F5883DRAFT_522610 [Diaporthaceae sp. PMI_573]